MKRKKVRPIYALCDPVTKEPRYIGGSYTPELRYITHIFHPYSNAAALWILELVECGLLPDLKIVAFDDHSSNSVESFQTKKHAENGCRLFNKNVMPGAERLAGREIELNDQEYRLKVRAAFLRRYGCRNLEQFVSRLERGRTKRKGFLTPFRLKKIS
jgi:hypothetical protein